MKKYIQKISIAMAFALLFVVSPVLVHADFNTLSNDCPTVSVANYTTQANISLACWGPSVSASPGDHINVRVWYHNTSTSPATAILNLNNPAGSTQSTFNFTGFVNGAHPGSGTINLSSAQTLTLSQILWYPNKSTSVSSAFPSGQNGSEIFGGGVNLGSIPGWTDCSDGGFCHSGYVTASFVVGSTSTPACTIGSYTINGSTTYASVTSGASANIAWSTSNCTSVTINSASKATSGSYTTSPLTASQNFTIVATDGTHTSTLTVTANVTTVTTGSCAIGSYTINGSQTYASVSNGASASLGWTTSNCTSVIVNGSTYTGSQANSNSISTAPLTASKNFTLIATDGTHTATRTVTANVTTVVTTPCSIGSFTASPTLVAYNTPTTLSWSTSNCTSVTVLGASQQVNGFVSTSNLTTSQSYVLTAVGTDGTHTASVTVTVTPQTLVCSIGTMTINGSQAYAPVVYGASANIAWSTSNCTSVIVNGSTYTGSQANSNSISTAPLTTSQNFTMIATDGINSFTRTVTANVGTQPTVCAINLFTANGSSGSISILNTTSLALAWTTSNCTTVTLNGASYGANTSINMGVLASGSYTYVLIAQDSAGHSDTRTVYVTVTNSVSNNCQITSFSPAQSTVSSGNSTTLSWILSNCTGAVIVSGPNMLGSQIYNSFTSTGAIYSSATYTLTAYGTNGASVTATTYVNVNTYNPSQNCYINTFTANNSTYVQISSGATANLMWSTTGCSYVSISGPGMYSQNQNTSGSMTTPAIYADTTYTLTAYPYLTNIVCGINCGGSNIPVTQTVTISTTQYQPYYPPVVTNLVPVTTIATNVTMTSARLNGLIPQISNASSVNAYFEYGTSYSLGYQTNSQAVSAYTLTNYFDTISTQPNTTYYYRAVMNQNGSITKGDIVSFVTPDSQPVVPIYVNHVTTYGTGTGSAFVSLSITDQYQTVAPGDTISYTIDYKNLSASTLSNVMLSVILPNGVSYRSSTQGMPTTDNTVVANLGTLLGGAEGSINIQAVADGSIVIGSNLVSTATLVFQIPSGAQDTAVAYYLNNVNSGTTNNLGAFALFGNGFFPTTFLGWIILIGIIIIVILIARHYTIMSRNAQKQNGTYPTDVHNDVHH